MQNNPLSKPTVSFGLALALGSVANALLVVIKEKSPAVQSLMKALTGHHWITHVAIVLTLFVIFGFLFSRVTVSVDRLIKTIVTSVLTSGMLIIGFYLLAG